MICTFDLKISNATMFREYGKYYRPKYDLILHINNQNFENAAVKRNAIKLMALNFIKRFENDGCKYDFIIKYDRVVIYQVSDNL